MAAWVLPFEALYQSALNGLSRATRPGITGLPPPARAVRGRLRARLGDPSLVRGLSRRRSRARRVRLLAAGSLERDRDLARKARVLRNKLAVRGSLGPPLSRWRCERTNGVTAWPVTPSVRPRPRPPRSSGSTSSSGSSGGRPIRSPAPPSCQCACGDPRRLLRRLDARRDRRAASRRRRTAAACRRGSRAPGTPSVSSSSAVAGTSRSDFTPAETTSARRARQLAEIGGDVGRIAGSRGARRRCRPSP